jgi:hypothetical protein
VHEGAGEAGGGGGGGVGDGVKHANWTIVPVRRDIRNGFCKGADCTLDICTLYEIYHTFLPPLGPWAE